MAYEWCSVVCENSEKLTDGTKLLLLALEIGFRHFDPHEEQIKAKLTHTDHHQKLASIVFKSWGSRYYGEVTTDLLHAWISKSSSHQPYPLLKMCAGHLISLWSFSPRLRRLVIRAIELIDYQEFEQVRVGEFSELLDRLCVGVEDMKSEPQSEEPDLHRISRWAEILLETIRRSYEEDTIQSTEGDADQPPKGIRLSNLYWEFLVEFAILGQRWPKRCAYSPKIISSLLEAEEWEKLECWIGAVWMLWPLEDGGTIEEDLRHATLSLFHRRPSAIEKLKRSMERGRDWDTYVPASFWQICEQACPEVAQQDGP